MKILDQAFIDALSQEWSEPNGFFYLLRMGSLDIAGAQNMRSLLASAEVHEHASLPRHVVSLLWFIPIFMTWNFDRCVKHGCDPDMYEYFATQYDNEIMRLLGVP